MLKLYQAEVLGKRPVVQHLLFGSLFVANWTPSKTVDAGASMTADSTALPEVYTRMPDPSIGTMHPNATRMPRFP